jgi:5S rRNA maturation endonuclease (ribonuclease M5)
MSPPRDRERLEAIEKVLDDLKDRGPDVAVIVEGGRDVAALKTLDVPEPIEKINVGSSLLNFCEDLARQYDSFILLTDWDPKGKELAGKLERLLRSTGSIVDVDLRRRLGRLLPYQLHEVESLDGHVLRMRALVWGPEHI